MVVPLGQLTDHNEYEFGIERGVLGRFFYHSIWFSIIEPRGDFEATNPSKVIPWWIPKKNPSQV